MRNDARGFLDDHQLDFDCPECGRSVKTTLGAARRDGKVQCGGGHTIHMEGSQLDSETRKVEKSMNDLMKRFG